MLSFVARFLADPKSIGAIAPSTPMLAKAMAAHVEHGVTVLEIGAGNGAITRHIPNCHNGYPLLIFEQDRYLAQKLREQFAEFRVLEGYFHESVRQLANLPEQLVIVSSIPFKSIPDDLRQLTVQAISDLLLASPFRKLVQFTYFNQPPFSAPHPALIWKKIDTVWANLPPATVWELRMVSDVFRSASKLNHKTTH